MTSSLLFNITTFAYLISMLVFFLFLAARAKVLGTLAIAVAYGGRAETLAGLAGLGDLIATCESSLSRNNTAGRLLGQGYTYAEVVKQMSQTAEGLSSVAPILELALAKGVEMPIVSQVAEVLAGTLNPKDLAPHLTTDPLPQGE